jgi:hypothetical protein
MKGPKTIALVVSGFVVLASGFAFADTTTTTTEKAADHEAAPTRSTTGCPDGFTGNHGQFVSSVAATHPDDHEKIVEAAHSDCGKPEHATAKDHESDDTEDEADDQAGDDHESSATSGSDHSSNSGSDNSGSSGHGGHDDGANHK